jgi:hypothetical protein
MCTHGGTSLVECSNLFKSRALATTGLAIDVACHHSSAKLALGIRLQQS